MIFGHQNIFELGARQIYEMKSRGSLGRSTTSNHSIRSGTQEPFRATQLHAFWSFQAIQHHR
jgi:hypothetical protein